MSGLKDLCKDIYSLDHVAIQCDDVHECQRMHNVIMTLDNMDRHEAVRLLMHVIHVQQLQIANAEIVYDTTNPFVDMTQFNHIEQYVKSYTPGVDM